MSVQKVRRPLFLMEDSTGPGSSGGGGGASKFIDLTDGPGDIQAGKTLVGNAEGTALEWDSSAAEEVEIFASNKITGSTLYFNGDVAVWPVANTLELSFDYGQTWETRPAPGYDVRVLGAKDNVMFVTYSTTATYRSIDGGNTWAQLPRVISALVFLGGDRIAVTSGSSAYSSDLYISDDLGDTYTLRNTVNISSGTVGLFASNSLIVHLGNSKISYSADDGLTFAEVARPTGRFGLVDNRMIVCPSPYITAQESTDNGQTWNAFLTSPYAQHTGSKYLEFSSSVVLAMLAGSNIEPELVYSFDNGQTWKEITGISEQGLRTLYLANTSFCVSGTSTYKKAVFGKFNIQRSANPPSDNNLYGVKNNQWTKITPTTIPGFPGTIQPGKVLVGNSDGTALVWKSISELE